MLSFHTLILFIGASAALALSPGPDNIFVLTQSAMHGKKAGILVTLGLCTGLIVHILAVVVGVATLLQTSAFAFTALKIAGALYLLYLAYQAFRAGNTALGGDSTPILSAKALYGRGIIMNITNPKVAIFFLAFLPQFADPSRGAVWAQILLLGVIFMGVALLIFSMIAWSASYLGNYLKRAKHAQSIINKLAGTVFVLLACRLLLSKA
ncbi:MAG: LysE family translocator [Moraxella sp.]|nr:LysE family translocator [Moraxella sp.]